MSVLQDSIREPQENGRRSPDSLPFSALHVSDDAFPGLLIKATSEQAFLMNSFILVHQTPETDTKMEQEADDSDRDGAGPFDDFSMMTIG